MQNDLKQELGTNFIEYAVAVNTDRAIPDAKSGLKPVARRILYSAFDHGQSSSKPHVKCANIVGNTMAELHPHGDSSIYGALVRLSQSWVMRYPLIDFHGNNGNIAGDGPAHYRYTEARLPKLVEEGMLAGIKKQNVDFALTYDEAREEPVTFPAIFPNLLCNPNTGIGVAMACNWLPHNLREVAQAINEYIDGKEPTLPGPDFPTGGLIINKNDLPNILKTGHGSVKVRGKYKIDKRQIIFYEIPYGVATESLLAEIGEACEAKEIEGISDIRDESNKKGLRIVFECTKDANPDAVVKQLFSKTNLQTSISYNQVALIGKTPTELGLKDCLKIYVDHNIDCIVREAKFDLNKAAARKEIVDGLLKALEDIDNIIALIKKSASASAAKVALVETYKFTEPQAQAIVDMKLGKLAGLEKVELQNERAELEEKMKNLNALISTKDVQIAELRARLAEIVKKYGDDRRTELAHIEIKPEDKEIAEVIPEDVVVIVSKTGDIKRIPATSFKVQKRNGKGVKSEDDTVLTSISTNTIDTLMIFTNKGKMYRLVVDNIPAGTNASKGVRIASLINMEADERVSAVTSLHRKTDAEFVVFITKNGMIKKTCLEEYMKTKKSTGIAAVTIKEDDELLTVTFLKNEQLYLLTKQGMSIRFDTEDINPVGRIAMGVKSIKLAEDDAVVAVLPIHKDTDSVAIFVENGYAKKTALTEFPVQGRVGKGVIAYKTTAITGNVVGAALVSDEDNILLVGKPNSICISAKDIPLLGRTSTGNIMVKDSKIISAVKI